MQVIPIFSWFSHTLNSKFLPNPSGLSTVKALLSPLGAYLILDTPEGGLLERGLNREGI